MDDLEYGPFLFGIADKVRKLLAVSGNQNRFKQHICDFSKKQAAYSQAKEQVDKQWQTALAKPLKPLPDRISYLKSKGWEQVEIEADSTPVNICSSFETGGWYHWKLPPMPPDPLLEFLSVLTYEKNDSLVPPAPEFDEALAYSYFSLATILEKKRDYPSIRNDTYAKKLSDRLWPTIENLCVDKQHIINTALRDVRADLGYPEAIEIDAGNLESKFADTKNTLLKAIGQVGKGVEADIENDLAKQPADFDESVPQIIESSITKGKPDWIFRYNGEAASINSRLRGLALIGFLLTHKNEEYFPLDLLKAVEQRGEEESPSEKIYGPKDIKEIKGAIAGLRGRAKESTDLEERKRLEGEIRKAEDILHKARNYKGKSRAISDKHRLAVWRAIDTVLKKIAPQSSHLHSHLNTFVTRRAICYYKPDSDIFWDIS